MWIWKQKKDPLICFIMLRTTQLLVSYLQATLATAGAAAGMHVQMTQLKGSKPTDRRGTLCSEQHCHRPIHNLLFVSSTELFPSSASWTSTPLHLKTLHSWLKSTQWATAAGQTQTGQQSAWQIQAETKNMWHWFKTFYSQMMEFHVLKYSSSSPTRLLNPLNSNYDLYKTYITESKYALSLLTWRLFHHSVSSSYRSEEILSGTGKYGGIYVVVISLINTAQGAKAAEILCNCECYYKLRCRLYFIAFT